MIKFWTWLKANWWVPFASVVVLISYFAGNSGKQGLKDMLQLRKTIEENKDKPVEEIADDFAKRFGLERI